jgi:hypothetical protein
MIIGSCEDESGNEDIGLWIRKSIYDNLINGKYKVSPNTQWQNKLIILDEKEQIVPRYYEIIY